MLYRYFTDEKHATSFNKGTLRFYEISKYIKTENNNIADQNESALINIPITLTSSDENIQPITVPATMRVSREDCKKIFCLSLTTSETPVIQGSNYRGEIKEDYIRLLQDLLKPYQRLECGQVSYYNLNKPEELPEPVSVENYRYHFFLYKEDKYSHEKEYRILFFINDDKEFETFKGEFIFDNALISLSQKLNAELHTRCHIQSGIDENHENHWKYIEIFLTTTYMLPTLITYETYT